MDIPDLSNWPDLLVDVRHFLPSSHSNPIPVVTFKKPLRTVETWTGTTVLLRLSHAIHVVIYPMNIVDPNAACRGRLTLVGTALIYADVLTE